jgi:hypothetical protein
MSLNGAFPHGGLKLRAAIVLRENLLILKVRYFFYENDLPA